MNGELSKICSVHTNVIRTGCFILNGIVCSPDFLESIWEYFFALLGNATENNTFHGEIFMTHDLMTSF